MAQFATILPELIQGQSVRRMEWEPFVRMFVLRDHLMCQCRNTNPWHHSLTWTEITASDWHPIDAEFGVEQGHEASITPIPTPQLQTVGNMFSESGLRHKSLLFGLLLKWWNSE
jgi:hypothetical protein